VGRRSRQLGKVHGYWGLLYLHLDSRCDHLRREIIRLVRCLTRMATSVLQPGADPVAPAGDRLRTCRDSARLVRAPTGSQGIEKRPLVAHHGCGQLALLSGISMVHPCACGSLAAKALYFVTNAA